jgi:hypothetical protein
LKQIDACGDEYITGEKRAVVFEGGVFDLQRMNELKAKDGNRQ